MTAERWLVADLGGTNTRVGLAGPGGFVPTSAQSFANDEFPDFATLLTTYLTDHPGPRPIKLCAGVAGPVTDDAAQLTNHSWRIEASELCAATGIDAIHLMNDLQAQGYALDDLAPSAADTLFEGTPDPAAPRLVLGLGTGSNIAVVHRLDGKLFVPPAEAGHTRLPHLTDFTDAFDALAQDLPHLPYEGLLSGPGLIRLHSVLTGTTAETATILATAPDTCRAFATLLGHVAGDLVLTHMACGGLYLIGGLARAMAPHLTRAEFRTAFTAKGPYTKIMQDTPLRLITDDTAALLGCTRYLRDLHTVR